MNQMKGLGDPPWDREKREKSDRLVEHTLTFMFTFTSVNTFVKLS